MGQVDRIMGELDQHIETQLRRATFEIGSQLIASTPVDFGRARANWIATVGQQFPGVIGLPGVHMTPDEARASLELVASTYKLEMGPIYITNNLEYIQRLNDGYSQQAPALFVEASVDRGLAAASAGGVVGSVVGGAA